MTLRAYMIYDRGGDPEDGALLAFANTAKEARKLGFSTLRSWSDTEWIDVAAHHMPSDAGWLAEQEGVDLDGEPRLIESPKSCERCELWGRAPLGDDGVCEDCRDPEEDV